MDSVNHLSIQLIRAALCGISPDSLPCRDAIRWDDFTMLEQLYRLSASQDLTHLVGESLYALGMPKDNPYFKKFKQAQILAVCRYEQLRYELNRLRTLFRDIRVCYLPLKGSVLRQYYPRPDMRTSCDIDILISPDDLETVSAALTEHLHYQKGKTGSHDVHFLAESGVHLELHYSLIEGNNYPHMEKILSRVWEEVQPSESDPFCCQMPYEFAYFYHIAHMVKHFEYGGCGLRTFMDLWILENRYPGGHPETAEPLLKKARILTFAQTAQLLSRVWFDGITPDEQVQPLLGSVEDFIFSGGIYGTAENRVKLGRTEESNLQYLRSRLILPYDQMKYQYPVLQTHKALLPFCEVHRWFRLLSGSTSQRILKELKFSCSLTEEVQSGTQQMLRQLGLKHENKEENQ